MEASTAVELALTSRFEQMCEELAHAWAATDSADVQQWLLGSAATFPDVLVRRVAGVANLTVNLTLGLYDESRGALAAGLRQELASHLKERTAAAGRALQSFGTSAVEFGQALKNAFQEDPGKAVPQFAGLVLTSLLVSGGPDGDGGAPDMDIALFGIGGHRSPLTHSILVGAALETALLSFLGLVRVIHRNLPSQHDGLWDELYGRSADILNSAATGVSVGMAYHLLVDGLAQPAPYHGLPFSMAMEAHQAVFVANGVAEATHSVSRIHASRQGCKQRTAPAEPLPTIAQAKGLPGVCDPSVHQTSRGPAARSGVEDQAAAEALSSGELKHLHRLAIADGHRVNPHVAKLMRLSPVEIERLRKYGTWFSALEHGTLEPLTERQRQFVAAARGERGPSAPDELLWTRYKARRALLVNHTST